MQKYSITTLPRPSKSIHFQCDFESNMCVLKTNSNQSSFQDSSGERGPLSCKDMKFRPSASVGEMLVAARENFNKNNKNCVGVTGFTCHTDQEDQHLCIPTVGNHTPSLAFATQVDVDTKLKKAKADHSAITGLIIPFLRRPAMMAGAVGLPDNVDYGDIFHPQSENTRLSSGDNAIKPLAGVQSKNTKRNDIDFDVNEGYNISKKATHNSNKDYINDFIHMYQ